MKKVRATGIGVHSPEEIIKMGKDDLKVLADMLGDKTFFFGDEPTTVRNAFHSFLNGWNRVVSKTAFSSFLLSLTSWFSPTSLN